MKSLEFNGSGKPKVISLWMGKLEKKSVCSVRTLGREGYPRGKDAIFSEASSRLNIGGQV